MIDFELIGGMPEKTAQSLLERRSEICLLRLSASNLNESLPAFLKGIRGIGEVRARRLLNLIDFHSCPVTAPMMDRP